MKKRRKTSEQQADLKKLGLNIRKARRDKEMSQESLAFAANLDRSYVGGVERGERNIAIANLKKIADALNVPVSRLLEGL
jgi:transcriptional regulator with XRE-family HTH domain